MIDGIALYLNIDNKKKAELYLELLLKSDIDKVSVMGYLSSIYIKNFAGYHIFDI